MGQNPPMATVIVTGAASGIGRATAARLEADSWDVVAVDVVASPEGSPTHCVADVATEAGNAAMVEAALSATGRLDALVLNAAVSAAGPIDTEPIEDLDRMLAINLRGVVLGVRAALPALRVAAADGGAAIAVTASVSGLGGDPLMWAYNTAKGGVVNFVRAAAIDLGPEGIRVNAVCPGPIGGTGMTTPMELHAARPVRGAAPLGSPRALRASRRGRRRDRLPPVGRRVLRERRHAAGRRRGERGERPVPTRVPGGGERRERRLTS